MTGDKLAALYPPSIDDTLVVERMPIAGAPSDAAVDRRGVVDVRQRYGANILADIDDGLVLVDKVYPHGVTDMMVMAADQVPRSSIAALTPQAGARALAAAHAFVAMVSEPELIRRFALDPGHLQACWNYDPDTVDRENGMYYEKRFHMHLNYWSQPEIGTLQVRRFGELTRPGLRHRLIDPVTFLAARIAYDLLGGKVRRTTIMPPDDARDLALGLPPGLKLRFDDWSALRDSEIVATLRELHEQLVAAHRRIATMFVGTDAVPMPWHRHGLRPAKEIIGEIERWDALSGASKAGLAVLARALRDVSQATLAALRRREADQIRHLTLAGLDYSIAFYTPEPNTVARPIIERGPVFLVINAKLFADIGGAGLPCIGRIPIVRLVRGDRPFTPQERRRRTEFQQEFVARVTGSFAGSARDALRAV